MGQGRCERVLRSAAAHLLQDGCQTLDEAAPGQQVLVVPHGNGVAKPAVDVGHQHVGHRGNGGLLQVHDMTHQLLVAKGLWISLDRELCL